MPTAQPAIQPGTQASADPTAAAVIHRVEVRPRRGHHDPRGQAVQKAVEALGLARQPKKIEHTYSKKLKKQFANSIERVGKEQAKMMT